MDEIYVVRAVVLGVIFAELLIRHCSRRVVPRWTISRGMGLVALVAIDVSFLGPDGYAWQGYLLGFVLMVPFVCIHLLARSLSRSMQNATGRAGLGRTDRVALGVLWIVGVGYGLPSARFGVMLVPGFALIFVVLALIVVLIEGRLIYLGGLAWRRIARGRSRE